MAVGHGMFGGSISLTGAVFLSRLPDLFGDLEGHHQDIAIHSLFPHFFSNVGYRCRCCSLQLLGGHV